MGNKSAQELLQGTLDMLILRRLALGSAHGYAIAKHIQRSSDEVLQVETGTLYPALRRLEQKEWIASKWQMSKSHSRELRFYHLTAAGRKQLEAEESAWKAFVKAITGVMRAREV